MIHIQFGRLHNVCCALTFGASLFAAASCRTDSPVSGIKESAAADGGTACSATIDEAAQRYVKLTVEGEKLTMLESSPTAHFAPVTYTMQHIEFNHAPTQTPKYSCGEGDGQITVWEHLAQVGSQYFQLNDAGGGSAEISCSATIDEAAQRYVKLTVDGDKLTTLESSPTAHFAPASYTMQHIEFNHAPTETPMYSCGEGDSKIVMWEHVAQVGIQYFQLAAGSSSAPVSCTATISKKKKHYVLLTVDGDQLTTLESTPNAHFAPAHFTLQHVEFNHAPAITPKYSCGTGEGKIVVGSQYMQVGSRYFQLSP